MAVTLTDSEAKIIARFLEMASDEFSNHGCNDCDILNDLKIPKTEQKKILTEIKENDGDVDTDRDSYQLPDWCWMAQLQKLLEKKIN